MGEMTESEMRFEIARLAGLLAALEGGYAPKTSRMLRRVADRLEAVPRAEIEPSTPYWTQARDAKLIELRARGLTFSQIADRFERSRNAVMGRHTRLMQPPKPKAGIRMKRQAETWSEKALTETFADRKVRLAKERADVHAND